MPVFKTPFNGYSIKFSPFYENRIAVATAQNFGILGNDRLHVLDLSPDPTLPISELIAYDTADGVYDVTWSESHDSVVVAAVADGSVKLYDLGLPPTSNPIRSFHEHTREVHSVDYNPVRRDSFLSSSWDDTVKLSLDYGPTHQRMFTSCILVVFYELALDLVVFYELALVPTICLRGWGFISAAFSTQNAKRFHCPRRVSTAQDVYLQQPCTLTEESHGNLAIDKGNFKRANQRLTQRFRANGDAPHHPQPIHSSEAISTIHQVGVVRVSNQ